MPDAGTPTSIADLRLKPHYSVSSLTLYLSCPLAYRFRYVLKAAPERTSKSLLFGSAFHKTLDRLAAMRMAGAAFTPEDAKRMFEGEWGCQLASHSNIDFEDKDEATTLGCLGQRMIEAYLAVWKDSKVLSHAAAFSIDVEDGDGSKLSRPVIGEYDMVVEREGKPLIVDWKTACRRWDEDKPDRDLQATLYCLAYRMASGVIPRFRFDVICKAKTPAVHQMETSRDEDSFRRLAKLFLSIDRSIRNEAFFPVEGSWMCGGCEYAAACKEWHRQS